MTAHVGVSPGTRYPITVMSDPGIALWRIEERVTQLTHNLGDAFLRVEASLAQMNTRLDLMNARLDAFSDNVSNDLDAIDAKLHRMQAQVEQCFRQIELWLGGNQVQIFCMSYGAGK